MGNNVIKEKAISAISDMSNRLQVSREVLEKTLKATIIKGRDGRAATNEEFVSFIVVANQYKLNPLTKEIYAFPDKTGGIIPIVSTDGWNNLMTSDPDYKAHYYKESEKRVTMTNAKPCPEWMEIHIIKKDNSEVIVREYLDECFNGNKTTRDGKYYPSPWDTHTKRMLRHKVKIQGAREAFGFGGIYEEDEAERIVDMGKAEPTGKPQVLPTKSKEELALEQQEPGLEPNPHQEQPEIPDVDGKEAKFKEMLANFEQAHQILGDKEYFSILVANDLSTADKITSFSQGEDILRQLNNKIDEEASQEGSQK